MGSFVHGSVLPGERAAEAGLLASFVRLLAPSGPGVGRFLELLCFPKASVSNWLRSAQIGFVWRSPDWLFFARARLILRSHPDLGWSHGRAAGWLGFGCAPRPPDERHRF